jgi:hypothetical protein
MEEVIKLVLPFLSIPKNCAQVLKKLASLAFYETYFIPLLLRANPRFDTFLTGIESWGPVGKAPVLDTHSETQPHFYGRMATTSVRMGTPQQFMRALFRHSIVLAGDWV